MSEERKKRDISKMELADHPPNWVRNEDLAFIERNDEIKRVIKFFVINSPCPNTSARGIDLTKYFWKEKSPPRGKYLYKRLLAAAELVENETLFLVEKVELTKSLFRSANMNAQFLTAHKSNRVAIVSNGNLIMDIFKAIRNSFAHCRFTIIFNELNVLIAMENGEVIGGRKDGKHFAVKARMILKLSTLSEWIRIMKEDYYIEEEEERVNSERIELSILQEIKNEKIVKFDDMIKRIPYPKAEIQKAKKRLITAGVIEYSRSKRRWITSHEEDPNAAPDI